MELWQKQTGPARNLWGRAPRDRVFWERWDITVLCEDQCWVVTCNLTVTQQYFTFATNKFKQVNYSLTAVIYGTGLSLLCYTLKTGICILHFPSSAALPVHSCVNDQGNKTAVKYSVSVPPEAFLNFLKLYTTSWAGFCCSCLSDAPVLWENHTHRFWKHAQNILF